LPIHTEPKHGDEEAAHSDSDILRSLPSLFSTELFYTMVVTLDLSVDRGAIHVLILRLNGAHWLALDPYRQQARLRYSTPM
jgi:hypothetical protein